MKFLTIINVIVWIIAATWRCTLYYRFPVCGDDPYGLGDILEFFLTCLALAITALCILWGSIKALLAKSQWRAQVSLIFVFIVIAIVGFNASGKICRSKFFHDVPFLTHCAGEHK